MNEAAFGRCRSIRLETGRLRMRRLIDDDVEWIWDLDQDPEVLRFVSSTGPIARTAYEREILPRLLRDFAEGPQYGFWAAERRDSGEPIGWFHLRPEKMAPFDMELGYRLRRAAWGQGLATEGSRELVSRALGEWGCPVVCASTLVVNRASRRVLEKVGMREEREFGYPAEWLPGWDEERRRAVRYAIRRRESSDDASSRGARDAAGEV